MGDLTTQQQTNTPTRSPEGTLNTSAGPSIPPTDKDSEQRSRSRYVPAQLVRSITNYLEEQTKENRLLITRADLADVARSLAKSIDERLSKEQDNKGMKPILDRLSQFNDMYSVVSGKDGGMRVGKKQNDSDTQINLSRKEIEKILEELPRGKSILAALKVVDGLTLAYNIARTPERALFDFAADHTGNFGKSLQRYFSVTNEGDLSLDLKQVLGLGKELRRLGVDNFYVRSDGKFVFDIGEAGKQGGFGRILLGGKKNERNMVEFQLGKRF